MSEIIYLKCDIIGAPERKERFFGGEKEKKALPLYQPDEESGPNEKKGAGRALSYGV